MHSPSISFLVFFNMVENMYVTFVNENISLFTYLILLLIGNATKELFSFVMNTSAIYNCRGAGPVDPYGWIRLGAHAATGKGEASSIQMRPFAKKFDPAACGFDGETPRTSTVPFRALVSLGRLRLMLLLRQTHSTHNRRAFPPGR
jgi:hypothetical protein